VRRVVYHEVDELVELGDRRRELDFQVVEALVLAASLCRSKRRSGREVASRGSIAARREARVPALLAALLRTHRLKTFLAIDRSFAARLERHFGRPATLGAHSFEHLPRPIIPVIPCAAKGFGRTRKPRPAPETGLAARPAVPCVASLIAKSLEISHIDAVSDCAQSTLFEPQIRYLRTALHLTSTIALLVGNGTSATKNRVTMNPRSSGAEVPLEESCVRSVPGPLLLGPGIFLSVTLHPCGGAATTNVTDMNCISPFSAGFTYVIYPLQ